MSEEADRAAILARRQRFVAMALAGLGGCAPAASPAQPSDGIAVLPVASLSTPATAEAPAPPVDSDLDGVFDADDQCPKIPAGEVAWSEHPGCPKPQACLTINPYATLQFIVKLRFARLSAKLHPQSANALDEIARALVDSPKLDVDVLGHCERAEPKSMARRRAESVRDALVKRGVASDRLHVQEGACEAPGEDARIVELPNLREREPK